MNFRSNAQRRAVFASLKNRFSNMPIYPGENIASSIVDIYPDRVNGIVGARHPGSDIGDFVIDFYPDELGPISTKNKLDDAVVGLYPTAPRKNIKG